jgi:hypothetical protein
MTDWNMINGLGGWEYHPDKIAEVQAETPRFYSAAPWAPDSGVGVTRLLYQAFDAAGIGQPTYRKQTRGTCVGRGAGRIGDLMQAMLVAQGKAIWQGRFSSEAAYAGARVEFGGSKVRGDGAVVGYCINAITKMGMLLRDVYHVGGKTYAIPDYDDDDLAVKWGARGVGVPDDLEPSMADYVVSQFAPLNSYPEARDAVAAGFPIIFGTGQAFWRGLPARRDSEGFLRATGSTAHCWIVTGVIDERRRPGLVLDNKSWGDTWVTGPRSDYGIPEGCFRCEADDFDRLCRSGEAYAVSGLTGFDPPKPGELDWLMI